METRDNNNGMSRDENACLPGRGEFVALSGGILLYLYDDDQPSRRQKPMGLSEQNNKYKKTFNRLLLCRTRHGIGPTGNADGVILAVVRDTWAER